MAWPVSIDARVALRGDRTITSRVSAHTAARGVLTDLPAVDWSITYDAGSETRAKGSVTFADPALWSADPFDALSPWGSELVIERGIVLVDDRGARSVEWIPMGRFVIVSAVDEVPVPRDGITLELEDRSRRLAERPLDTAAQTNVGARVVDEIERLVREVPSFADVELLVETDATDLCPTIDLQRDRRAAVHKLAEAIGCEVFFDRLGRLRLRPVPTLDDPVAWVIRPGEGGTLLSAKRTATREGAYSRVFASQVLPQVTTAEGETPPVPLTATAIDDDPASPTYYYGNFGDITRKYASPLFTTQAQVQRAADSLLARVRGASSTLEVSHLPNEAMDPGDVIRVEVGKHRTHQLLESFTVGGRASAGAQTIGSRGEELPPEETPAESTVAA